MRVLVFNTLNVALKGTDGAAATGNFDGPFAVEHRSIGAFQPLAFDSAGFAFAIDAVHWPKWAHHRVPSCSMQIISASINGIRIRSSCRKRFL